MVWEWIRFFLVAGLLLVGMFFEALAVFGVQKFKKALNRMHAAAMGDTLGVLFIFLGLMVMRGFTMDSLKLFLVILFFWMASPVSGHMISRLEAMTNPNLGEISVIRMGEKKESAESALSETGNAQAVLSGKESVEPVESESAESVATETESTEPVASEKRSAQPTPGKEGAKNESI